MAEALILGGLVGDAISKLSDVIIEVVKQTAHFKSNLRQLQSTLLKITPIFKEIEKLNKLLDRPKEETDGFVNQLKDAEELVRKSLRIKYNLYKRYRHSCKLQDLDGALLRFFQFDVQVQQARDIKETLAVARDVQRKMDRASSAGNLCSAPLPKSGVVGFDEPLQKLKGMVLWDGPKDDCSVVVVSAAGGCGKTTLVTMLCHDPVIKGKFRDSIFFVTVSNTPDIKVIVKNLFQQNYENQQLVFQTDEDAINQLGSLLSKMEFGDILLVLDDVWSVPIIEKFRFKIPGYRILVTSRFVFTQFSTYMLEPLSDKDATTLFRQSAFPEGGREHPAIPDDLVNEMVKCCKKHPLALSVVGGSLNGKHVAIWKTTLRTLSEGRSVLDLNEDMLLRLEKGLEALDEKSVKQCYLDLGLFPEDQRISASALMDMWVDLYNHDEEGLDTLTILFELSFRNIVTLMSRRKDSIADGGYCEEQFVMQHDMLRELAIHLSSKEPILLRKRLIINARGKDLPKWIEHEQPIHARLLSISTDETFSSRWYNMQVPDVEVLVLSFMSRNYTLPQFLEKMRKLKVLLVTNYGFYPTELKDFPPLRYLSSLTRIRLERVTISSLGKSILELVNLRKISFAMCEIGQAFEGCTIEIPNMLPNLLEIEMDYCHDLVGFPALLCNVVHLKKLCITNCHELGTLPSEFRKLTNLEVLKLTSCTKLAELPESIASLQKLSILDISDCLNLNKLPKWIGKLVGLRTIHMKGCTGLHELPLSVEDLCQLEVVCDEEISYLWNWYPNVKINLVEEDKYGNLMKIISANLFL